jgi:nitrogen regulatory protein P-II 1
MKEIKAFIPASRAADVLEALKEAEEAGAGVFNLAAFSVDALPHTRPGAPDAHYSVELGGAVVREIKIEILCRNEDAPQLIRLIKTAVGKSCRFAGWIIVTAVEAAEPVGESPHLQPA